MKKTKNELNLLSYDEFRQYEQDFIVDCMKGKQKIDTDDKRYLDELHYYSELRFKEQFFQMIGRWRKSLDDENADQNDKDVIKFLLEDKTDEEYYQTSLFILKTNLGELIYL